MFKLPKFNFKKNATIPTGKELDYGNLPILSANELIEFTGQFNKLRLIKRLVQIDDATYDILYQSALHRYFELVQLMPASQAHHHAVPAGLIIHTLEVIEHALTLRQQYKLPQFAPQEVQENERHVWTFAIFVAALLHDVAKRVTMCRFELNDGKELPPFDSKLQNYRGQTYTIKFVDTKYYRMHEQLGLAFMAHLLDPIGMNFLLPKLHIMQEIMDFIHEDKQDQGTIGKVLRLADQHSTGASLAHISSRRFKGANSLNIGERLMTQLRRLLAANHFVINRNNGNVYTTKAGYTYIVSKTLADELRNTMREQGETDIPSDNNRIFDILQEFGFAETNANGQIIHFIRRVAGNKTDIFSVLKFRSNKLFRVDPGVFQGEIHETGGKSKKEDTENNDLAIAAKSVPANYGQKETADTKNRRSAKSAAPVPSEPIHTAPVIENPMPATVESVGTLDSATGETAWSDAEDTTQQTETERKIQNTSTESDDNFGEIIDDVPSPTFGTGSEAMPQPATVEEQQQEPAPKKEMDDSEIAEKFMEWLRNKVRNKEAIINASSGMVMKVDYMDGSAIGVVTPRSFSEFAVEVLGMPSNQAKEKSTTEKLQRPIHTKKLNIPGKRGHVHTYNIKKTELGGFNQRLPLYLYLFTLEKFAGGDNEIREILENAENNTNLAKR